MKSNPSASQLIATSLIMLVFSSPVPAQDAAATETAAPTKVVAVPPTTAETATRPAVAEPTLPEAKPPGGWKVLRKDDHVLWCTEGNATGSRVRKERRCMTPQQYQEMVASARRATEEATRRPIQISEQ